MHMHTTNAFAPRSISVSAPRRVVLVVSEDQATDSILTSVNHYATEDPQ